MTTTFMPPAPFQLSGAVLDRPRVSRSRRPARTEPSDHDALMEALRDPKRTRELMRTVCGVARTRYGILEQDAEDNFHEAVVTYLGIHDRYPEGDNHFGLLVGIFHKKCLEHLGRSERRGRVARRFVTRLRADRPALARGEDPRGPAVERVIRDEDAELIRSALDELRDDARQMILDLAEGRETRLEMIERLGVNRNTFDTRLRAVRLKLKQSLEASGVEL